VFSPHSLAWRDDMRSSWSAVFEVLPPPRVIKCISAEKAGCHTVDNLLDLLSSLCMWAPLRPECFIPSCGNEKLTETSSVMFYNGRQFASNALSCAVSYIFHIRVRYISPHGPVGCGRNFLDFLARPECNQQCHVEVCFYIRSKGTMDIPKGQQCLTLACEVS